MRMLPFAGIVLPEPLEKSENFMRKAFSLSGAVMCMTHFQPSAKLLFAVAVVLIASMPVTVSVVVAEGHAVELVVNVRSVEVATEDPFAERTI